MLFLLKDTLVGGRTPVTPTGCSIGSTISYTSQPVSQGSSGLNTEERTVTCGRKLINGREKKRKRRPEKQS